ncbi:hypothetical protein H0X06_01180 [Candidatus Dependentiae bacterium]|nr:hypothetical protein [Candidatus Dependentiae bacterium]
MIKVTLLKKIVVSMGLLTLSPLYASAPILLQTSLTETSEQDEDASCPICFELYSQERLPVQFNCKSDAENYSTFSHVFCLSCIKETVTTANTRNCPLCTSPLCLFDPTKKTANIPQQAKGKRFNYKEESVINSIKEITEHIPACEEIYKKKAVITPQSYPELTYSLISEAFIGALVGAFIGRECGIDQSQKPTNGLKLQRALYIPAFFGSSLLLNRLNPERKNNKLLPASWYMGILGGIIASYNMYNKPVKTVTNKKKLVL